MTTGGPTLHVFRVEDAAEYWIAFDEDDVQAQRREMFGADCSFSELEEIHQHADDYVMTISDEDEDDLDATRESHTCAEWCAQEGRGLLAACEP